MRALAFLARHCPFLPYLLADSALGSLDISECRSLENLILRAPVDPGILIDTILPSITSSELSRLSLPLITGTEWDDPQIMETLEGHLCHLARTFQTTHGGRKMEMWIGIMQNDALVTKFLDENPMPKLEEEAIITVDHYLVDPPIIPDSSLTRTHPNEGWDLALYETIRWVGVFRPPTLSVSALLRNISYTLSLCFGKRD